VHDRSPDVLRPGHHLPRSVVATIGAVIVLLATRADAETPLPSRRPDRWVYDDAAVISADDEDRIEALNTELFRKTGVAIVVVTVPRLEGETIDGLAVRIGQSWGGGRKGQDRGLVVAFARDDRRIFVATGYGTEGYLPDGRVGELLDRHALPDLRAGRISEGLTGISVALVAASAQEFGVEVAGAPAESRDRARPSPGVGQLVLGALAVLVFVYLAIRHPWFLLLLLAGGRGRRGGAGFGGGAGHGGFGGGGFGGGGAGRGF
jgi:uncharacterized protein